MTNLTCFIAALVLTAFYSLVYAAERPAVNNTCQKRDQAYLNSEFTGARVLELIIYLRNCGLELSSSPKAAGLADKELSEAQEVVRLASARLTYHCEPEDVSVALAMDASGYDDLKAKVQAEFSQLRVPCFEAILAALELEQEFYSRQHGQTDIELLKERIVTEKGITSTATSDLAAYLADQKKVSLFTEDNWYSAFHLGTVQMPEYDAEGKNQGFKENNFFGRFEIDARYHYRKKEHTVRSKEETRSWSSLWGLWGLNAGVTVDFASAHVINCEALGEAETPNGPCVGTNVADLRFNDISNIVIATAYAHPVFWLSPTRELEFSPGFKLGMQSREELVDDGDSVADFQMLSVRLVHNDFASGYNLQNGMPRFRIEYARVRYEDWLGQGPRYRNLYEGSYRVLDDNPLYLSFRVNDGTGPDEIALVLSYGFKLERLLDLL